MLGKKAWNLSYLLKLSRISVLINIEKWISIIQGYKALLEKRQMESLESSFGRRQFQYITTAAPTAEPGIIQGLPYYLTVFIGYFAAYTINTRNEKTQQTKII